MNGKMQAIVAAGFLVLSTMTLLGQAETAAASDTAIMAAPVVTRTIVVSLEDRRLALLEDGVVKKVYPVAVGEKDATPSPAGTFTIVVRVTNPTYYHDGKVVPPGPQNPVGTRWMGLSQKGYGIHGTNAPHSVGKAASHGCIRMGRRDLEDLFAQVRAGDVVEIVGERDAETAAIFGGPAGPATPAASVLAKAESQAADGAAVVETAAVPADR